MACGARAGGGGPGNLEPAGAVDTRLAAIAASEPGVARYRPWTALCEDDLCRTPGGGGPWYSDRSHMTAAGGAVQASALARALNGRVPSGG